MLNAVLSLCVLIECWHMFYYGIFFDKFAHVRKVVEWTVQYKNMSKHYLAFAREYMKDENKELREAIGGTKTMVVQILDQMEAMGGPNGAIRILKLLKPMEVYFYLGQQAVELLYWIFIVFLLITLPFWGKVLTSLILVLSWIESKYNKSHDVGIHIFDSIMCIAIFVMISSMY